MQGILPESRIPWNACRPALACWFATPTGNWRTVFAANGSNGNAVERRTRASAAPAGQISGSAFGRTLTFFAVAYGISVSARTWEFSFSLSVCAGAGGGLSVPSLFQNLSCNFFCSLSACFASSSYRRSLITWSSISLNLCSSAASEPGRGGPPEPPQPLSNVAMKIGDQSRMRFIIIIPRGWSTRNQAQRRMIFHFLFSLFFAAIASSNPFLY